MTPRKSRFRSIPLLALPLTLAMGCDRESNPPLPRVAANSAPSGQSGKPQLPSSLTPPKASSSAAEPEPEPPPHPGPWFVVTKSSVGIYRNPKFEKTTKFAYARSGGRLPVLAKPVSTDNCSGGWYELATGGFVCGNSGTTDEKSKAVSFVQRTPNLEEVLPYQYARNSKNGTPLYRSIPSREQMLEYEPYLEEAKAKAKTKSEGDEDLDKEELTKDTPASDSPSGASGSVVAAADPASAISRTSALAKLGSALDPNADLELPDAGSEEPKAPWWQDEDSKDNLHELTIEQLASEADGVLAKRMVKGFYVAIDKTFRWNNRLWYRTTKGLVAPADRFWQTKGSTFKGVELGDAYKLPVGWVYGGHKQATKYAIEGDGKSIEPKGSVERFTAVALTGEKREFRGVEYHETRDGLWIKSRTLRLTEPGDLPEGLQPGESWVDVNLSQQTLVAFRGETPTYATLVSTGKKSSIKEKDHSTPTGQWRIRVKHVTDTMDGDGTAAGDLPYSIEDVPFVMYFHRSYALHGAFWHANYGVPMSHGCVNLAPLDAKHLFFALHPRLPQGSHGAWSDDTEPGSIVKVHN